MAEQDDDPMVALEQLEGWAAKRDINIQKELRRILDSLSPDATTALGRNREDVLEIHATDILESCIRIAQSRSQAYRGEPPEITAVKTLQAWAATCCTLTSDGTRKLKDLGTVLKKLEEPIRLATHAEQLGLRLDEPDQGNFKLR